jgi:sucrose-6-phosphate hydrolase SacC (GH32 family)
MKQSLTTVIFILYCVVVFSQGKEKEVWFNETYRPQFHFTPEENRMGSPISIVKADSTYHLFYQWNPHNLQQGFVNWGYANSNNLLKWKHKGICLNQPENISDSMLQTPWWGSVVEKNNQLFAWANSWGEGIFRYSNFSEGKWNGKVKTTGTDELIEAEPFVFWYEKTSLWIMVAYNRGDSTMNILNSPDGLSWNTTSSFNFKYGFASMTELPVDRKADDTRWLFITESGNYMLGKFDGEKFELVSPVKKFDNGRLVGGSVTFSDKKKERTLLVSELKSEQHPDISSNGQLSFPTEISLHETITGIELLRKPAEEIRNLYVKDYQWDNKKIYPGVDNNPLKGIKGECFHIKGRIDLKNCDMFGIIIRSNKDNSGTDFSYNVSRGVFELEGSKINFKPENGKIDIELLIDRSSVELFVDGGRHVISTTHVPDPKSLRYLIYSIGGEIVVEHLEVHELKSAWRDEK